MKNMIKIAMCAALVMGAPAFAAQTKAQRIAAMKSWGAMPAENGEQVRVGKAAINAVNKMIDGNVAKDRFMAGVNAAAKDYQAREEQRGIEAAQAVAQGIGSMMAAQEAASNNSFNLGQKMQRFVEKSEAAHGAFDLGPSLEVPQFNNMTEAESANMLMGLENNLHVAEIARQRGIAQANKDNGRFSSLGRFLGITPSAKEIRGLSKLATVTEIDTEKLSAAERVALARQFGPVSRFQATKHYAASFLAFCKNNPTEAAKKAVAVAGLAIGAGYVAYKAYQGAKALYKWATSKPAPKAISAKAVSQKSVSKQPAKFKKASVAKKAAAKKSQPARQSKKVALVKIKASLKRTARA